jgi:hypothetical protein
VRFSQPRSMLVGVAVVLSAAAPAHASTDRRVDGDGHRYAMRGEQFPTKHTLRANDTGNSLEQALLRKPHRGADDPVPDRPGEVGPRQADRRGETLRGGRHDPDPPAAAGVDQPADTMITPRCSESLERSSSYPRRLRKQATAAQAPTRLGPERDRMRLTPRAGLQPWSRQPPKRDRAEERSSRP